MSMMGTSGQLRRGSMGMREWSPTTWREGSRRGAAGSGKGCAAPALQMCTWAPAAQHRLPCSARSRMLRSSKPLRCRRSPEGALALLQHGIQKLLVAGGPINTQRGVAVIVRIACAREIHPCGGGREEGGASACTAWSGRVSGGVCGAALACPPCCRKPSFRPHPRATRPARFPGK